MIIVVSCLAHFTFGLHKYYVTVNDKYLDVQILFILIPFLRIIGLSIF